MISTFLLLLVTLILYAFFSIIKPKKFPPGPAWYPFIGSSGILQKMTKQFGSEFQACLELSKKYSTNVLGLKTSTERLIVVFGDKNVRQVFNCSEFDARPHNFFSRLRCLGHTNKGITFANGEIWREQRQFTVKNLKLAGYGKTKMEMEIQNELSRILEYIKRNNNQPINIVNLLGESVINVLWKFVAGEPIKEDKLKLLLNLFRKRGQAFSVAGGLLNYIPWSRFIIPELSGYSLITKLNQEIAHIIEETIEKHKNKEVEGNDFIYSYLEEMNSSKSPFFTEDQLKIVCLDLLIAGSSTTSNYLGFALLKVLISPDIQEKIFNEINSLIGDKMPCWNDSHRFIYTSAFLLETYRYYSIVPMAGPRLVQKETSIDGYLIPEGSTVLISLGDIHRDPEWWGDPHVFRPERFIDESGMVKTSDCLHQFGLGRRRCPGDSLAKSFTFITFVGILQKYRIQCSNGTLPSDVPSIGILSAPRPYTAELTSRK